MTELNKSSKKSTKSDQELTFEEQMQRLEEIVEILDDGEASLDEMLLIYEEGMKRSQYCREYLERAEQKITLIQSQNNF
jgi:exodeoxyribonuclease VII small subunit